MKYLTLSSALRTAALWVLILCGCTTGDPAGALHDPPQLTSGEGHLRVSASASDTSEGSVSSFYGTATLVDSVRQTVTINEERQDGSTGARAMSYPVSDPEVLAKVRTGRRQKFTVRPNGTQDVITDVSDPEPDAPLPSGK